VLAALRSVIYNIFYVLWSLFMALTYLPLLPILSPRQFLKLVRFWLAGMIWGARIICGIRWRIEGRENLPQGACIIASKHQSAWETLFYHLLVEDPVYALKKELLSIPLIGLYMRKTRMIAVDRGAGAAALRTVLRKAEPALAENRQMIIFPEGTRVAPGDHKPWQPGVAALYARFGDQVPLIPVALNSGLCWGRNSFIKRPGLITIKILPPVPKGLSKKEVVDYLKEAIESSSDALCETPPQ
jgi:1-acyl-sn-glycerol-3-phosphate acyltransferase